MPPYPTAQQRSSVYTLESPRGTRAVFNDNSDVDYIGSLSDLTGLDSPEVRANLYDLVEADGSLAPYFYNGFRPVTMEAEIAAATMVERNLRESKLRRVLNECLRADGTLTWTPAGSIPQFVRVRKYQPPRITGGWVKSAFVSLVAPDPYILSKDLRTFTGAHSVWHSIENQGDADRVPERVRITGPATAPSVRRSASSTRIMELQGYTIPAGRWAEFNFVNRTVVLDDGTNLFQYINFPTNASWWMLEPGNNGVHYAAASGLTAASQITIDWRDAWL